MNMSVDVAGIAFSGAIVISTARRSIDATKIDPATAMIKAFRQKVGKLPYGNRRH